MLALTPVLPYLFSGTLGFDQPLAPPSPGPRQSNTSANSSPTYLAAMSTILQCSRIARRQPFSARFPASARYVVDLLQSVQVQSRTANE